MIEQIPDRLERTLRQTLMPNERVLVKLKGAFKEALVCTDARVLILKGGVDDGADFRHRHVPMSRTRWSLAQK